MSEFPGKQNSGAKARLDFCPLYAGVENPRLPPQCDFPQHVKPRAYSAGFVRG